MAEPGRLTALRHRVAELRAEIRSLQAEAAAGPVADYVFATPAGPVRLSALFGPKADLFVIHNMGTGCANCTMWADGFNGLYPHLADRAAFVVSSPDDPARQATFAAERGWRFPMVSHAGTSFAADMGFLSDAGRPRPGISVFRRRSDVIMRVSAAGFEPGDDFCAAWHLFDLLPQGADGWEPRFRYP